MTTHPEVRIAIIGTGSMGVAHARDVSALDGAHLVGVCDSHRTQADTVAETLGTRAYYDYLDLLEAPDLDAVIIATPHYSHPAITLAAFARGIHVLVEKPIAVHVNDAARMVAAYEVARQTHPDLIFAAMFMQRTYGNWRKIKDLIASGELGQLIRTTWIITDWFRTQTYYNHGGWRATWQGEGGGVLLNQAPHNLDLYQWLVGMPQRVTGFAAFGKYHTIEVEDEVTAYFEHQNGMIGHFITSTAESPGTNRLEIAGENGKLIYEDNRLTFYRNRHSVFKHIRESTGRFEHVENWRSEIPFPAQVGPGHKAIIENFIDVILNNAPLVAPGTEGINSVMLGNAIILSSELHQTVEMPLDGDAYEELLRRLIDAAKAR